MIGLTGLMLLIFIVLQYCAQKWAYKCCKELQKLNRQLADMHTNLLTKFEEN